MKTILLLTTLLISFTSYAKIIQLECLDSILIKVIIDTDKSTLFPDDGDYPFYMLDLKKYPKYGKPIVFYNLTITSDEYIGTKALPDWWKEGFHTFIVNRKKLSYKRRRTPSNKEISKFSQKTRDKINDFGELELTGQCKIKPKNLI